MLFDPKNLVCTACEVIRSPLSRKFIVPSDQLTFTSREPQTTIGKENVPQVDKVDGIKILSTSVYTETGMFIGNVEDFLFDANNLSLIQIDVEKRFLFSKLQSFLIHRSEIVKVEAHRIIVKDDILLDRAGGSGLLSPRIDWQAVQTKTLHTRKPEII